GGGEKLFFTRKKVFHLPPSPPPLFKKSGVFGEGIIGVVGENHANRYIYAVPLPRTYPLPIAPPLRFAFPQQSSFEYNTACF
ncbi:MAG: hypothetical protein IKA32_04910, partial [Lentisphaeria bacterium]|nr:hypothetical protein [Lentisphaeria bacterium]